MPFRVESQPAHADNKVWYNRLPYLGSWVGWGWVLAGTTDATPAYISSKPGRFDLVVKGTNFVAYHSALVSCVFSAWDSPTGTVDELSINAAYGNLHMLIRTGTSIWPKPYDATSAGWIPSGSWYNIPGAMEGRAAIATTPTGILVVVRGSDDVLYVITR